MLLLELLHILIRNFSFFSAIIDRIFLIANHDKYSIISCFFSDIPQPISHFIKTSLINERINEDNSIRPPIKSSGNRSIAFHTTRVPNLQIERLIFHLDEVLAEVPADSRLEVLRELLED